MITVNENPKVFEEEKKCKIRHIPYQPYRPEEPRRHDFAVPSNISETPPHMKEYLDGLTDIIFAKEES